jgi:uncharacterized membrane protein (DUF106 family)
VSACFDVLLRPLDALPVLVSLTLVSLTTAILVLLIFRVSSDQDAVAAVKRQIHAGFFEMRLLNDDLSAMLHAARDILRHEVTHVRLSLVPLFLTAVPLVVIVAQLQCRFGYVGVPPGHPVLVTAELKSSNVNPLLATISGSGLQADTPTGVWIPALHQAVWRVVPVEPGEHAIEVRIGDDVYVKTLQASTGLGRSSPLRPSSRLDDQILHPCETPLPDEALLGAIRVAYPVREIDVFGWHLHWMVVYLLESIVFVQLLKPATGVRM